jgi:hypothetical protein
MLVRGRRGPRRFAKALPSEDGEEHPEEARRRPICVWGGPSAISTELLDRELGPCAGIPLRGAPMRISGKRELSYTSVKSHRAGSLHSLAHLYSALLLALTFRV